MTPARHALYPAGAAAARLAVAALAALTLSGCESTNEKVAANLPEVVSLEARMLPIGGSVVAGSVVFGPTRDGAAMKVYLTGLTIGPYRVVIHTTGNCSSPNGFSAGPPLKLPGAAEHVLAGTGPSYAVHDGSLSVVLRVPGIALDGPNSIDGRSVVVHVGAGGSLDAQPDVPNNRAACGVIAPMQRVLF